MDATKTVYVGSIPFDQTEEQVMEIAKSIGPVVDMKLLFDPLTGKSKGYAFVKYTDHETAASAVRNLNNFALGNRMLKCSFSSDNSILSEFGVENGVAGSSGSYEASDSNSLPALPPGMQLFANQTPPQAVSGALSTLDQASAYQLIAEAKQMAKTNPQLTRTLLEQCPQLAHALVETCLLLNMVTPDIIQMCLNKKMTDIDQLSVDHVELLKQVNLLTEAETNLLPEDKRKVVIQIRDEIKKGSYGTIY